MPRKRNTELVLINLRLRKQDINTARRKAEEIGIPYQHVIRTWVAAAAKTVTAKD